MTYVVWNILRITFSAPPISCQVLVGGPEQEKKGEREMSAIRIPCEAKECIHNCREEDFCSIDIEDVMILPGGVCCYYKNQEDVE